MVNVEELLKELSFKAIRSSGAGGQHVNKVSSKIELFFNVNESAVLNEEDKSLLIKNLSSRLTKNNELILTCDESRSQHKNKEIITSRFIEIIQNGLKRPKKRKKTRPSIASVKKRLAAKKKVSEKKSSRKKPDLE
ncbi:MAG: aminoacyl-tRNA hydrolase [Flavobacteriaceae bacterium]|jgi:ribosome-associated protein|nr:aminoacyl-tRNA hydrolase [Flavobacteriaceae bacterium]MCB0485514.1 aminoacyl-tRNA hydrolase [Flavobacteriaceae bacterium]